MYPMYGRTQAVRTMEWAVSIFFFLAFFFLYHIQCPMT